jgi:hypothetical protein
MGRLSFPIDDSNPDCFLVAIDRVFFPLVAGALAPLSESWRWASDLDYELGYNALGELYRCMTSLCISQLLESNDRLYRLLSAGLFGTVYTKDSDVPLVISPSIPDIPPTAIPALPGLLARGEHTEMLLDNALNGAISVDFFDPDSIRAKLDAIKAAIEASGTSDADQLEQLIQIVALLGAA